MYFFTADEHYFHSNIIRFCGRPVKDVEEMNELQIGNHNSVVKGGDTVVHAGDFTLLKDRKKIQQDLIDRLNGNHIFLKGSHDYWLPRNKSIQIWEKMIEGHYVVVCHYNMRTWARSHYNSWQLYGHSHGKLEPEGKQWDIGVDNNNFFPVSFDQIKEIMAKRPDNISFLRLEERRHGSKRN
jgi:calcineurin-like phosphoesterase family protein